MIIKEFLTEAHKTAIEKGWWKKNPDGQLEFRELDEQFCLFHSEVSEALEVYRDPSRKPAEVWFSEGGKPEGFGVEIVDLLIRLADSCQAYGVVFSDDFLSTDLKDLDCGEHYARKTIPGMLSQLHERLTDLLRKWKTSDLCSPGSTIGSMSDMVEVIFDLAGHLVRFVGSDCGDLLVKCVTLKMSYNKNRPFRHGGKRC